jgi:ATP-dependent protease ClpP protease subunit
LRKPALELASATEQILEPVQALTGKPADEIRSWFNSKADKCFSADEAIKAGLADGLFELPSPSTVIG